MIQVEFFKDLNFNNWAFLLTGVEPGFPRGGFEFVLYHSSLEKAGQLGGGLGAPPPPLRKFWDIMCLMVHSEVIWNSFSWLATTEKCHFL